MIIHDVNDQICKQFVDEMGSVGPVTAAQDVREVAENSVSTICYSCLTVYVCDMMNCIISFSFV